MRDIFDELLEGGEAAIYGDGVNPRIDPPKWIYITPLLDEVTRVKEACPLLDFQEPSKEFYGTKSRHFEHLIVQGRNVVTTHSRKPEAGQSAPR